MRLLRVVSSLILLLGLILAVFGGMILRSLDRDMRLLEAMQNEGMAKGIDTTQLQAILIRNAVGYIVVGLVAAISGIGLFFRRNWARRLWVGLAVVLLCILTYQSFRAVWHSGFDWGPLLAQTTIIGVMAFLTWYIGRRRTAGYMVGGTAE